MTKQMLLGDCFEVEKNISRVGKTVKKSDRFDTEPTFSNSTTRNVDKSRSISLGLIRRWCSCFAVLQSLL